MLKKKNRATKRDIDLIFKEGRFITSPNFTFKFLVNKNNGSSKISFIAPKSVAKLAVKRNLLRRRGYDALKKYIIQLPLGIVGVFIFKKCQNNRLIIEDEIKNILHKIN